MDFPDVMVLVLLALADICLIAHLRRRRARYMRMDRMTRSLELHIRGELDPEFAIATRRSRVTGRSLRRPHGETMEVAHVSQPRVSPRARSGIPTCLPVE